jgi:hypothetical protein
MRIYLTPPCGLGPRIANWRSHPYPEEWLLAEWPQPKRADQMLALDPDGGYSPREARGNCQTALADRVRLSGTGPRSL